MSEISRGEKAAIYIGGAFVMAIIVWVVVAALRAEGMLDYKTIGIGSGIVAAANFWRRRQRRRV